MGGIGGGVSVFKGTEFQFGKVTNRELDDGESHSKGHVPGAAEPHT